MARECYRPHHERLACLLVEGQEAPSLEFNVTNLEHQLKDLFGDSPTTADSFSHIAEYRQVRFECLNSAGSIE